jgi:hypothetical protein
MVVGFSMSSVWSEIAIPLPVTYVSAGQIAG